ncbi:hypothetical protein GNI_031980 [Gregarina niphandrodes]|uniref:Transmembrane protein n=1 Tax=Gregarina niphandrodes TaxID=110365 RepID=A0A023BB81_GRENI|nr:hypothetical protein GNI_031980 [Gregarina niphandrodes]EZG78820.1 hypothetical protein GNI_031980 [Gregarina niphandrodes]|eukprot:XP_011129187.1 hypothetical protein GNI_031980 [Gregarina niphandrodes]
MRLLHLLLFGSLVLTAPEEEPETKSTEVVNEEEEEEEEDETDIEEEQNSGPHITVTPINGNPLDILVQKCDAWEFPDDTFKAQSDVTKIYIDVAKTADGPFKANNITKFISVGGIHIVGQDSVPDEKVRHVGHTLAKVLDHDKDGKFDNPELVKELLKFHPTLFIMADADSIMDLMNAQEAETGFPMELKFCPFAFDFEEAAKIVPGGKKGDATCELEGNENKIDRSIPFVLDHLVGRGFGKAFTPAQKKELDKIYQSSVEAGTFDPDSTGCPPDSDECGEVMFASWALSSLNGFDKCWCEQMEALKFCDPESLRNGEPELVKVLEEAFGGLAELPEGDYKPKNKNIIGKSVVE